jgi:DNA-binding NarL/FixJ family response regulator
VRLVIGEDSLLFREGLARLLADVGHDIVATTSDAPSSVDAVRRHQPDVAILDIRMPPDHTDDGARAARQIRRELPDVGIVLLSQHVETRNSLQLVATGRFGYLLKDRVLELDTFLDALDRVADGGTALDPEVVARLVASRQADDRLVTLTQREREVLAHMAEGHSNVGIARRLHLTERTVESHINSILGKLEVQATDGQHRRVLAVIAYLDAQK